MDTWVSFPHFTKQGTQGLDAKYYNEAEQAGISLEIYFQMVHNALVSWCRYETASSQTAIEMLSGKPGQ